MGARIANTPVPFMPKTIEVKNYRSYTEAAFDFSLVHMAMVNGQNGVGKSSLFMDAIADCLYEQTRKEDIGGLGPRRDKERQYHLYLCPGRAGLPGHPHQDQERARHPGPTAVEPRGGRLGR